MHKHTRRAKPRKAPEGHSLWKDLKREMLWKILIWDRVLGEKQWQSRFPCPTLCFFFKGGWWQPTEYLVRKNWLGRDIFPTGRELAATFAFKPIIIHQFLIPVSCFLPLAATSAFRPIIIHQFLIPVSCFLPVPEN